MSDILNQELKAVVKKEGIYVTPVCQQDSRAIETKIEDLEPIDIDTEKAIKTHFLSNQLQLENDTLMIQNQKLMIQNDTLKTDNSLRQRFATFIISLLACQTVFVFIFLFFFNNLFDKYSLTGLITSIVGQSYFLPSFLAKYLFKNDGVRLK